jgi:hypothetical protein
MGDSGSIKSAIFRCSLLFTKIIQDFLAWRYDFLKPLEEELAG